MAVRLSSGRVAPVLARADAAGRVYATSVRQYPLEAERVGKQLDSLELSFKADMAGELHRVRSDLAAKLKAAKSPRSLRVLPRRAEIETVVREAMGRAWKSGEAALRSEAGQAREFAASFTPVAAVKWLAQAAFWITDVLADDLLADAQRILVHGLKNGTATSVMVRELWEAFVPYLGGTVGEKVADPFRLETIVRTNTTTAYNHGRLTAALDPEVARFVDGVQYSAILDERTTEVCQLLHGKVFLLPAGAKALGLPATPEADLEVLLPPRHFNCRSIIHAKVVGDPIDPADVITPGEVARAKELSGTGFMQHGAHRNYGGVTGTPLLAARVALLQAQVALDKVK